MEVKSTLRANYSSTSLAAAEQLESLMRQRPPHHHLPQPPHHLATSTATRPASNHPPSNLALHANANHAAQNDVLLDLSQSFADTSAHAYMANQAPHNGAFAPADAHANFLDPALDIESSRLAYAERSHPGSFSEADAFVNVAFHPADPHVHVGGDAGAAVNIATTKRRFVWTPELHARFEDACNQLGLDSAKPKSILRLMNVEGLTKANIKSHLQKYRCMKQKQQSSAPAAAQAGAAAHLMMGAACADEADEPPSPPASSSLEVNLKMQEEALQNQLELQSSLRQQLEHQARLQEELGEILRASGTAQSGASSRRLADVLQQKRHLDTELQGYLRSQNGLLEQLNAVVTHEAADGGAPTSEGSDAAGAQ